MANLKDKLAQKVEFINTDEQSEKVIMLNPSENTQTVSVIPDFAITIAQAKERIALLQNFVREMMIPNVDYGLIPGCQKPSLYKSGAEKLCDVYGFSKHFEVLNRMEDWEKGIFHFEIKSILINKRTGLVEAEGLGSCSNKEKKYQYQDGYSIINTIMKMAKKRALVDAVLSATRSSDIFTQDVEDLELLPHPVKTKTPITINHVYALAKKSNISTDFIKNLLNERYKASNSSELSPLQVQDLYECLMKSKPINPNN
jgi:hypothetical protein